MSEDKVKARHRFTDDATGYECVVLEVPWFCGYVRLPDHHPWHDKGYGSDLCGHDGCYQHSPESQIDVHGGITFDGRPHGETKGFWYGFDCAHAGDFVDYEIPGLSPRDGHHWTVDEVKAECSRLAKQLADV
jgi:hypothetical protein